MAILAGIAVALGIGAALASPPPSASFDGFDGRTWLPVQREVGPQLLLVNGISGLIEASADLEDVSDPPRFVGAGSGHTLFRSDDSLIAVDDGSHVAATRSVPTPDRAVVAAGRVLVLGERAALLPLSLTGEPSPLTEAPAPVPGVAPVADAHEQAWYLASAGGRSRAAVRVDPEGAVRSFAVAPSTTRLAIVNGSVHAMGMALVPVEKGRTSRPVASAGGTTPSVAVGTGGLWATASGSTLTMRHRGTVSDQVLDGNVTDLGVWHGSVAAVTTTGVVHGRPGSLEVIPEAGPGATLHLDGGLLWVVTPETAIAIAPDQRRIMIPISSADLSLCVGDCSAAAASSFLEQVASTVPPPPQPREKDSPAPTTTAPPKRLEVASVAPTLPSTTLPRDRDRGPTTTVAATVPPETTLAEVPTTLQSPPPSDDPPPDENKKPDRPKGPPKTEPTLLTAPPTQPVFDTTTTTATTTTTTPTTTTEPEPPVGLEYDVQGGDLSATAFIRVLGRPSACGETGVTTTAQLSWTGSSTGSREVLMTWASTTSSRSHQSDATITAEPGELRVAVTVCGVTASDTATVTDPTPPTTTTTTTTTPPTTPTTTPTTPTTPTTTPTTKPTTPTTAPPTTAPTTTTTTTRPTTTTTRPTTTTTRATTTTATTG